ncbi:MAG: phosphoenolpyruvate--protein phosphotransferase [Chloroflexota bacterium]
MIRGIPASPGQALGPAFVIGADAATPVRVTLSPDEAAAQLPRLASAAAGAAAELLALERVSAQGVAEIMAAQRLMLEDPDLIEAITALVRSEHVALPWAVHQAAEAHAQALEAIDDAYIRERAADVRDVAKRLVRHLTGEPVSPAAPTSLAPASPAVIVAHELTPSETVALPADRVLALVTETGTATGHTAILAKALGIPAVVGAAGAVALAERAAVVAVDGDNGTITADPAPEAVDSIRLTMAAIDNEKARLAAGRRAAAVTKDGQAIEIGANIGFPGDVPPALANGADGIGLLRTEFLFMRGATLPNEQEQYEAYAAVLAGMEGRPVVIRTLDVGGDKGVPALDLPRELNPFLGWRALRLCLDRQDIFRTQLRAIYRASVHGKARIMFPMVASLTDVLQAKEAAAAVRAELDQEGVPYDRDVAVGIMVEIPAAALLARRLGREVDFFSIGTNDLTQYTLAVDRTNERVARFYDPLHPAVLHLIAEVAAGARENGIWAGMCGELAGDPLATELLVGLGLTELSVAMPLVGRIKDRVRQIDGAHAKAVAEHALTLATGEEVRQFLRSGGVASSD